MSSSTATREAKKDSLKHEVAAIVDKLGEMEAELDEHTLVIDTLSTLPSDRKCFRLVNGVLVERTVADALPLLQANHANVNLFILAFKTLTLFVARHTLLDHKSHWQSQRSTCRQTKGNHGDGRIKMCLR